MNFPNEKKGKHPLTSLTIVSALVGAIIAILSIVDHQLVSNEEADQLCKLIIELITVGFTVWGRWRATQRVAL